jgi:hypothetical protein
MKEVTKEECLRRIAVLEADITAFETAADFEVLPKAWLDQPMGKPLHACHLSWLRDGLEGFSVDLVDEMRVCIIAYLKRLRQETKKRLVEAEDRESEQHQLDAEYGARVPSMMPVWAWAPLLKPWAMSVPADDPRRFDA